MGISITLTPGQRFFYAILVGNMPQQGLLIIHISYRTFRTQKSLGFYITKLGLNLATIYLTHKIVFDSKLSVIRHIF